MSYDPYAPPHAEVERATPPAHAPGRTLALLYGACVAGDLAARVVIHFAGPPLTTIARVAASVTGLGGIVLAMAWLYAAWKGIPETHRGTVTPRRAAFSLLVPLYNAYWALAVNLALCDTLDDILSRARSERRAPRVLAMIAGAAWLGSFVIAFAFNAAHRPVTFARALLTPAITGALWLTYMVQCDRARDEVARLGDRVASLGAPRLSQLQLQRGPGVLAAVGLWLLVLVCGLGCWQLLAPGERPPG